MYERDSPVNPIEMLVMSYANFRCDQGSVGAQRIQDYAERRLDEETYGKLYEFEVIRPHDMLSIPSSLRYDRLIGLARNQWSDLLEDTQLLEDAVFSAPPSCTMLTPPGREIGDGKGVYENAGHRGKAVCHGVRFEKAGACFVLLARPDGKLRRQQRTGSCTGQSQLAMQGSERRQEPIDRCGRDRAQHLGYIFGERCYRGIMAVGNPQRQRRLFWADAR